MAIIYEGRNPQIKKDWNGESKVRVAALSGNSKPLSQEPDSVPMNSQEYADWHREKVVIPTLLAAQARRKALKK